MSEGSLVRGRVGTLGYMGMYGTSTDPHKSLDYMSVLENKAIYFYDCMTFIHTSQWCLLACTQMDGLLKYLHRVYLCKFIHHKVTNWNLSLWCSLHCAGSWWFVDLIVCFNTSEKQQKQKIKQLSIKSKQSKWWFCYFLRNFERKELEFFKFLEDVSFWFRAEEAS